MGEGDAKNPQWLAGMIEKRMVKGELQKKGEILKKKDEMELFHVKQYIYM